MSYKTSIAVFAAACMTFSGSLTANNSVKPNCCDGPVLCPISTLDHRNDCCHRWHVDIGLLYQQPVFDGVQAGISYTPSVEFDSDQEWPEQTVTDLTECLDYALGLTVSLGHFMKHDNWYLGARFDWIDAKRTSEHNGVDNPTLFYTVNTEEFNTAIFGRVNVSEDQTFTKIGYSAEAEIFVLDVLLSRGSYHSTCFSYEPYVGIKAFWISTWQEANYHGNDNLPTNQYVQWRETEDNWAAGPMFGFNAEYYFLEQISLFSDSDIAVTYGEANKTDISSLVGSLTSTNNVSSNESTDFGCHFYVPVRTIIGLKFSRYCFDDQQYVALKIGYDLRTIISIASPEDFAVGGLYTNLVWHF